MEQAFFVIGLLPFCRRRGGTDEEDEEETGERRGRRRAGLCGVWVSAWHRRKTSVKKVSLLRRARGLYPLTRLMISLTRLLLRQRREVIVLAVLIALL